MNASFLPDLVNKQSYGSTIVLPWGEYEFTEPISMKIPAGATVDARRCTFKIPPKVGSWINLNGGSGWSWWGGEFLGASTLSRVVELCTQTNAAGKEPMADQFTVAMSIAAADTVRVIDPFFQQIDRALYVEETDSCTLERGQFIGICQSMPSKIGDDGKLNLVHKDALRSLYHVNVANSHNFKWHYGIARSHGGALVAGNGPKGGSSRHLEVYGLKSYGTGDNAVYGSSTPHARVEKCMLKDNKGGHGVKLRGPRCVITRNECHDSLYGYMIEGIGTTPDGFGAASYGQEVSFNFAENCSDGGIQIDQTAKGKLYPRHLSIIGNQLFDCATKQSFKGKPIQSPIHLEGGAGYLVDQNIVIGYAAEAFLYIGNPIMGTRVGHSNVTSKRARIMLGNGLVDGPSFSVSS